MYNTGLSENGTNAQNGWILVGKNTDHPEIEKKKKKIGEIATLNSEYSIINNILITPRLHSNTELLYIT